MISLSRRHALLGLGLPLLTSCATGKSVTASTIKTSTSTSTTPVLRTLSPTSTVPKPSLFHTVKAPKIGGISSIPTTGNQVAITIDDGIRADVILMYLNLCACTDMRVTFFANGCYDSWRQVKPHIVPLIESGKVVIGNHTWSHPNLTDPRHSDSFIAAQITQNERHFKNLYGVNLRPFFRPPYGYINPRVERLLREHGYDAIVMWNGTFGDDQNISSSAVAANARRYLEPGNIVIGHANHPGVLKDDKILDTLIESRRLTTVTMKDVVAPVQ